MNELIFGFDDNLGLPKEFFEKIKLKTKSYHDLGNMIEDFENGQLSLIFIPVGTLLYIKTPYHFIAEATFGDEHITSLVSQLVTAKNLTLSDIASLKIGRVNPYCTTSFWSPLIYFMNNLKDIKSVSFIDTDGFVDMLRKVANKEIDSAMVWEKILKNNPDLAKKVHVTGTQENLPTPVVISSSMISAELKNKITHFKFSDKESLFSGFAVPNMSLINQFIDEMKLASQHFNLNFKK